MLYNKKDIEDEAIVSTKKIKEGIKTNIYNPKKNEIIKCYKVGLGKNSFSNPFNESSNIVNSNNLHNNQKINESSSSFNDEKNIYNKDINDKNILPVINFFKCNEIYIKEKILKMNSFRKRSKNFIEKKYFAKKEDIDQNKINDILKDIELLQNNLNTINVFNENIFFLRNKQHYLNKSLDLYNYEFNCKYIIYFFKIFFIYS